MKALIDGDVIVYQAGHASDIREYHVNGVIFKYMKDAKIESLRTTPNAPIVKTIEPEPIEHCLNSVKKMLGGIIEKVDADEWAVYITDEKKEHNFRHNIYPDYKANRDATAKPLWYKEIRKYMCDVWNAEIITGSEADDALGCMQSAHNNPHPMDSETCICTIDKDLDMIAGWHYNWNKDNMYWIEPEQADKAFWKQMLTGDTSDNIPGIYAVGPVSASHLIDSLSHDNTQLYFVVRERWIQYLQREPKTELDLNGDLLWIQRKPGEGWKEGLGIEATTNP